MIKQSMRAKRAFLQNNQGKQNFCLRNSFDLSKCWLHTDHTTNLVLPSQKKQETHLQVLCDRGLSKFPTGDHEISRDGPS